MDDIRSRLQDELRQFIDSAPPVDFTSGIFRTVLAILRHGHKKTKLLFTGYGWTNAQRIVDLTNSEFRKHVGWADFTIDDLEKMACQQSERIQFRHPMVRARYGHSLSHVTPGHFTRPPRMLLHATAKSSLPSIVERGFLPQQRKYVHLTSSPAYASLLFDAPKMEDGVILQVRSGQLHSFKFPFYQATETVWQTLFVPPDYIEFEPFEPDDTG